MLSASRTRTRYEPAPAVSARQASLKPLSRCLPRLLPPVSGSLWLWPVYRTLVQFCFDCPMKNPVWTSVPFGVFLCLDCSGRHRSYGTHISFVRSANMDVWTEEQIRLFEAGGNSQARGFFKQHGHTGYLTVDQYSGPTGQKYKTHLKALSEGKKPR